MSLDPTHPYLSERDLSPALIDTFGLGFFAGEKGTMVGRVCIPIHDADGTLIGYAGRWVGPDDTLPAGEEKYRLPKGFHKSVEVFNLHRVKGATRTHLVVVEGFFGTIALHGHRVPAVGLMGSSVSEAQIRRLQEHCPALRCVTVCLDGDEPGRKVAELVAARLAQHWWVRIAMLPDGMQPDTVPRDDLLAALGRKR